MQQLFFDRYQARTCAIRVLVVRRYTEHNVERTRSKPNDHVGCLCFDVTTSSIQAEWDGFLSIALVVSSDR